jgi:hypothetical protein
MISTSRLRFYTALCLGFFIASCTATHQVVTPVIAAPSTPAHATPLATNAVAALPIVVASNASPRVRAAAQTLAEYLKRISGGDFKIEERAAPLAPSTPGIAVGTAAQFPALAASFKTDDPTRQEDYILRSHEGGVLLVGASELAVEHAVWDVLYRLGYRQFFPGEKWEVVPNQKNLSIAVDAFEHPDYYARRIWFGYGSLPENKDSFERWQARNRATSGIALSTGHSYDGIIARHKAEFEKHPEYLTQPGGNKFCVSNPGLRQLVVNDALAQFEKNPELQSISLDPSDGGGWESDSCRDDTIYKSITDRVVSLANEVAASVNKKFPGKFIGVYAYSFHSPPPTIKVDPHVVVSIATAFITGGYTADELLAGWQKQGAMLGVREYYGVNIWDHDLPGEARGSNLDYLKTTIPRFHSEGARFLSAESSDNWAPNGLGYYIASRLLWDVNEAQHIDELQADFFEKAFGPARAEMAEYYRLIDGSRHPLLSDDLIGRMYRQLDAALQKTNDPKIRARLLDLALYTRYVELFSQYAQSSGDERQKAFEDVLRFAWRIRGTQMIHTWGLWRSLKRDKNVEIPKDANYRVPEGRNPWKSSEPFSEAQIVQFVKAGVEHNKLLAFEPVAFSADLVPATPLKLGTTEDGDFKRLRGSNDFYTWVAKAPSTVNLQVRHGLINQRKGAADISLFASSETLGEPVAAQEIAPDKELHDVRLATTFDGLHHFEVNDHSSGCEVHWPEGTPIVIESSLKSPARFTGGRWSLYFYVPKGTKTVGGYRNAQGQVLDGSGNKVFTFDTGESRNYWSVPVPSGQDGKLWRLDNIAGQVMLMTVPPYLARSAEEMMVPAEVLKTDR